MRVLALALCAAACSSNNGNGPIGHYDAQFIDVPQAVPTITSFKATPSQLSSDVATAVTWTWTYADQPTVPEPACTIDNGVGDVTSGQTTMVTLTQVTTFTLTCTNSLGSGARQVVIGVPPVAPVIAMFTASPTTVTSNTATPVTWTWTFANAPSPTPVCTIEHGVGTISSGSQTSVTQTTSRAYQLRCTNSLGTSAAVATINVNECSDGTHDCQTNATCGDTTNGFTCTCKTGFTGNGDVCNALEACGTTPSLCGTNATCVGGSYCQCNAGYVGDGTACTKLKYEFVTSTTGAGNLSQWTGAGTATGLAAADAICQARANAVGLTGTYVAWMSDSTSDAYCRVQGFTGKKSNNCGQGATLPTAAGPWVRPNSATATAPTIDKLVAPSRITYAPANVNESGAAVSYSDRVYTGTDDNGVALANTCSDWTNATTSQGAMGDVSGGGTSWTHYTASDPVCSTIGHLRCMETGSGPSLPSRHAGSYRRVFLTSATGTGQFSTWSDAGPYSGVAAADAICQARARYGGYANPQNFKAWLATSSSVSSHIFYNGPWARPDGTQIAASYSALYGNGRFDAPIYQQENGSYAQGNLDAGSVWTGSSQYGGYTGYYCSSWLNNTTSYSGYEGRFDLGDYRATEDTTALCSTTAALYCFEDD